MLEWAFERFAPRISISTAFQTDGVGAARHGLRARPGDPACSASTRGGCPRRPSRSIEQTARALPEASARPALARGGAGRTDGRASTGRTSSTRSVENRLLCCQVRKVRPLTSAISRGLDAWITGLRRDQWATPHDIRKIEIDHDHGAIVKLNPLAEWTEEEVWDYVARARSARTTRSTTQGYTSIGCAPCTRADQAGRGPAAPGAGGGRRTRRRSAASTARSRRGGLEHELHALIRRAWPTESSRRGEAREVALGGGPGGAGDGARRDACARGSRTLIARRRRRRGRSDDAEALLESVLELGLQTGRIRALYGPGGEQAALATLPPAAARPRALARAPAT